MSEQTVMRVAPALVAVNGGVALAAGTSATVLAHNSSRAGFFLSNEGAADAWVSYGTANAAPHAGHYLKAGGGVLTDDGWAGEVHVFSTSGTIVCFIEKSYAVGDDEGERTAGADTFHPVGGGDVRPTATLPITGV